MVGIGNNDFQKNSVTPGKTRFLVRIVQGKPRKTTRYMFWKKSSKCENAGKTGHFVIHDFSKNRL